MAPARPAAERFEPSALLAITLAARLPFLLPGYGTDPDAWRVALAGRVMRETGRYASSRVPGHPVQDLAAWALATPLALNLATALLSVLAVGLFHRLARRFELPHPFLLALGFGFLPVVFVHSVDALDYVWALAFMLGTLELLLGGHPVLAGVSLGLAAGCRLTSLVLLVPMLFWCPPERRLRLGAAALLVGALCYAPVVATYGAGYLRFTPTRYPPPLYIAKAFTVDLLGVLGLVGIVLALMRWRPSQREAHQRVRMASLAMLAASLPLFFRLPDDAAYLLPVVPFVLWSLATLVTPRGVAVLAVALVLSGFVLRLREARPAIAPVATGPSLPLGRGVTLDLAGPILVDHARRVAQGAYAEGVLKARPRDGTLLAGEWWPILVMKGAGAEVVQYPTAGQLDTLASRPLRYVPEARGEIAARTGLDVTRWGARPLDVP